MNDFSCWSFVEFYLMESVSYEMSTLPQEKHFLASYQYLQRRIEEYHTPFTEAFAETLRDYLWFAAIGEARHSGKAVGHYIQEMWDYLESGRTTTYNGIARYYRPTEANKDTLRELFGGYCWGGSFGGGAWDTIVKSVSLYDTLTPSAFIDHCADLQHNGGVAFDKGSVPFWNSDGYGSLVNFLTFKFNAPHLVFDLMDWDKSYHIEKYISRDIAYIVNKSYAMCRSHRPRLNPKYTIRYGLDYDSPYIGDETFSCIEEGGGGYSCYECGDWGDEDDMYWDDNSGEYYCSYCVSTCDCCDSIIYGDADYHDANDNPLCEYCYENYYISCEKCGDLVHHDDMHEFKDEYYCEYCHDDIVRECSVCYCDFHEDDIEYENGEYYCEECYEDLKCDVCGEMESGSRVVSDLDHYQNCKFLTSTRISMCPSCIKKHLDTGVDMWYSTIGIVMSVDIEEVLRYPYKELLEVHLEREVVYEEFSNNIQGGTYYG